MGVCGVRINKQLYSALRKVFLRKNLNCYSLCLSHLPSKWSTADESTFLSCSVLLTKANFIPSFFFKSFHSSTKSRPSSRTHVHRDLAMPSILEENKQR